MLRTDRWIPLIAGCLLAGTAGAATISVSNGVQAGSYIRDCRSSTTLTAPDKCIEGDTASFTGTIREISDSSYPGALQAGVLTSNSLARTSGIDVTGSTVEASGDAFQPPQLRLGVFTSTNYARASTGVLSVQGYSWDGSGGAARSLSLESTFTGSNLVDGDLSPTFAPEAAIFGNIRVFSLLTPTFDVEESFATTPAEGICYFSPELWDCLQERADFQLEAEDYFGGSDTAGNVEFTLEPGRYYFTWVYAAGIARFGAWLDARNTVVTTWSNTAGLSAAAGEFIPITAVIDWLTALAGNVAGVGPGKTLARSVATAQAYYAVPDVRATCTAMAVFSAEVRLVAHISRLFRRPAPWKISAAQANQLLAESRAITTALGCR